MLIGSGASSPLAAAQTGQPLAAGGAKTATAKGSPNSRPQQGSGDQVELSPEAQKEITKLKARDQEVRAHEAAHMAAGGGIVRGGANFSYQQGPDGKRYAVGGEVSIDASPVKDNPRATQQKALQIQAAALAPADPSAQDRKVAAQAAQMAAKALAELAAAPTQDQGAKGGSPNLLA